MKAQDRWLQYKIAPDFQRSINTNTPQNIQKIRNRRKIVEFTSRMSFTLTLKPHKDLMNNEYYRLIFLMNIDTKILNKIFAKKFKNTSNRLSTMIHLR